MTFSDDRVGDSEESEGGFCAEFYQLPNVTSCAEIDSVVFRRGSRMWRCISVGDSSEVSDMGFDL